MSDRVAREPSPFRSGLVHTALSLAVFTGAAVIAGAAIHLSGDASEASPARQIALFEPAGGERPQLKTRFASAEDGIEAVRTDAGERAIYAADDERTGSDDGPNLGVEYDDGTAKIVRASMSADEADAVRINGVAVSAGRSWQETRELKSLSRAPISAVSERTSIGYLPAIAEDGRTPAGAYARPFSNPEGRPTVSIVLGGLGINYTHTKSAIEELPPEVTLSFAPSARNLQSWIDQARAAGHEVLLEVPMEPYEYGRERPHTHVLDASIDEDQLSGRLDYLMSRASGYFGIINYQGSKFATDETATKQVAEALAGRGVALVEDGSLSRSAFQDAADGTGLRFRRADTPVDARPDGSEIETKLFELETLALENGSALGTGFAYPITIDILKAWTAGLQEKGIALAPASSATRAARLPEPKLDTAAVEKETGGQAGG